MITEENDRINIEKKGKLNKPEEESLKRIIGVIFITDEQEKARLQDTDLGRNCNVNPCGTTKIRGGGGRKVRYRKDARGHS